MVVKDKFPLGWMLRPEMLAIIVTHHCTSACEAAVLAAHLE